MGRWSRPLARTFVTWLGVPAGARWLDVGCGTGALTTAICELAEPAAVTACDPSDPFVAHARKALRDARVSFVVAGAEALPGEPGSFDCIVSALALNFMVDPARAVASMKQRLRRGGVLAASVWDYREGIEFLRCFWDEAVALDRGAAELDEGHRFPLCQPEPLSALWAGAGLCQVAIGVLEIPTRFQGFDDLWTPFLRGTGPAPSYAASLSTAGRERLRDRLASRLKSEPGGGIALKARAWAVRGVVRASDA